MAPGCHERCACCSINEQQVARPKTHPQHRVGRGLEEHGRHPGSIGVNLLLGQSGERGYSYTEIWTMELAVRERERERERRERERDERERLDSRLRSELV